MKARVAARCLALLPLLAMVLPLSAQNKSNAPSHTRFPSRPGGAEKRPIREAPEPGCAINKDGAWEKCIRIAPGVDLDLIYIPAGSFLMGSAEGHGFREETPQHRVTIGRGFWLGKYPLTQAQWRAVLAKNPSTFPGDDHPLESVTWEEAVGYIQSLNRKLSRRGDQAFRLPTEAEWEYACRAGNTTEFSFGNDENQLIHHGWYSQNATGTSHPVGQFPPNPWGLYDMHGNVWQWCQDLWNRNYKGAPSDGSAWISGGGLFSNKHVLRGGSWYVNATWCRCAARYQITPDIRFGSYGFRLALPESQSRGHESRAEKNQIFGNPQMVYISDGSVSLAFWRSRSPVREISR